MTHRLMVICLGGLAGAGALVCCDLDEGLDEADAASESETLDAGSEEGQAGEIAAQPSPVQ